MWSIVISDFARINSGICLTFHNQPLRYSDLAITSPPILGLPASPAEVYDCVNPLCPGLPGHFLSIKRGGMLLAMADGDDGHGMGGIDPAIIHLSCSQHSGLAVLQAGERDLFITGLLWRRAA